MESQSAAKHCKKSIVDEKIIGKIFNMIKVLSFSHVENSRRFYNIMCLNCKFIESNIFCFNVVAE